MTALLTGQVEMPSPSQVPDCRHLASCAVAVGLLGARMSQILPGEGAWHVFDMQRPLTSGERAMLGLAAIIGEHVGRDPNGDIRALYHRLSLDGLCATAMDSDDLRAVHHVREILGDSAMNFLAIFVVTLLERLQSLAYFNINVPELGDRNLAPIVINLIGDEVMTVRADLLMDEINSHTRRKTH